MNKILLVLAMFTTCAVFAQTLPPPSREVFKCEKEGKVVYSDVPCLGAKRVDVEPTRGLNKMSGTEQIGADVRQERHNEQMAEALRPILGENAEQRAQRHRRAALSPQSKTQCGRLDQEIATMEKAESQAAKEALHQVQERLFLLRTQYRDLKC